LGNTSWFFSFLFLRNSPDLYAGYGSPLGRSLEKKAKPFDLSSGLIDVRDFSVAFLPFLKKRNLVTIGKDFLKQEKQWQSVTPFLTFQAELSTEKEGKTFQTILLLD